MKCVISLSQKEIFKERRKRNIAFIRKKYKRLQYKSREEWLNARIIGGSSASAIVGKSPYKSKFEIYTDLTTARKGGEKASNEAMEYGTKLEPLIRKEFAYDHPQYKVFAPKGHEMFARIDKPWMTATLDGHLVHKISKKKLILEIKTHDIRNREDDEEWKVTIPINYFIQVIHYLNVMNDYIGVILVARLRFFDYYHQDGKKLLRTETRYYFIDRKDEEIQKQMKFLEQAETKFWEENVTKHKPPKTTVII